jgi:23S rRNA pseudouridine1911/1915/1917 synthase
MEKPFVVKEDKNYCVLYKPEKMHSAPLIENEDGTLLSFCSRFFPEVLLLNGKKKCEGGLIHRLDFETQGLVLFARNQISLDHFLKAQDEGLFCKRYDAYVSKRSIPQLGFPFPPELKNVPFNIESAFRAFGPGKKVVRPVLIDHLPKHKDVAFDKKKLYVTKILVWNSLNDFSTQIQVSLIRGFRHQIRAHLAWLGFPILNDDLYGGEKTASGKLALKAVSLSFPDPVTNNIVEVFV